MLVTAAEEKRIRTEDRPRCALCGSAGRSLYAEQQDRLFGAPGRWNLKQCSNRGCGLVWLDPMPRAEDLWKAYANYYTHTAFHGGTRRGLLRRLYWRMKHEYLAGEYRYRLCAGGLGGRLAVGLLHLLPFGRADADADVRFLPAVAQGRLLDVGCGTGEWLCWMRELGWQVEGLDFDAEAVRLAQEKGLEVRCGAVEQQQYAGGSFDAVTLNHVIEHVPDPAVTLAECGRILKEDGRLVLFTPNCASLGRRLFKQHWRGWEPPRHLHLFGPDSMRALMKAAGFAHASIRSVNSRYIWEQSWRLWACRGGSHPGKGVRLVTPAATRALRLLEQGLLLGRGEIGECLAVQGLKR